MIPKEKAIELCNKNYRLFQNTDTCFGDCDEEYKKGNCTNSGHGCGIWFNLSKQCALIAVDEVLEALEKYDETTEQYLKDEFPNYFSCELQNMEQDFRYYQKVKQEIELL